MRCIFATALLLFSFSAFAQTNDRDKAIDGFAKDLAAVQAKIQAANAKGARIAAVPEYEQYDGGVLKNDEVARSEPRKGSEVVGTLSKGSEVEVVTQSGDWSGVLLKGGTSDARVAWVMKDSVGRAGSVMYTQADYASFADDVLDTGVEQAQALLDRYRNNPYVRISGFTTEVGMTGVSLSVQFEFK